MGNNDLNQPSFQFQQSSFVNEVRALRVESVTFPTSYYSINSSNNQLTISETVPFDVVIPPGNYDAMAFCSAMTTALNTASVNAFTYSVSISSLTGKLTVNCSGNFHIDESSYLFVFPTHSPGMTATTTNVMNLNQPTTLFLCSMGIKSRIMHPVNMAPKNVHNSILTAINVSNGPYEQNVWVNSYDDFYETDLQLNEFGMYLQDERGHNIDFNGLPFSVTLGVLIDKAY